jgi:hypothetical protein
MKLRAKMDEVAEVGWLLWVSRSPKLPERERSLVSLEPLVAELAIWRGGRRGCGGRPPSAGTAVVPRGVLSFRTGGCGRVSNGAISVVPFVTGRTCGDGGIERPRRGVRLAELLREPGIGGRRRGAGADMVEGREEERLGPVFDARMGGFGVGSGGVVLAARCRRIAGCVRRRSRLGGQDASARLGEWAATVPLSARLRRESTVVERWRWTTGGGGRWSKQRREAQVLLPTVFSA